MGDLTYPAVAINAQGEALAVYGGTPCFRSPTSVGAMYSNCTTPEMYAYEF